MGTVAADDRRVATGVSTRTLDDVSAALWKGRARAVGEILTGHHRCLSLLVGATSTVAATVGATAAGKGRPDGKVRSWVAGIEA